MNDRIKIVCPDHRVPVYDAIVDGERIGSWSNSVDAERAAHRALRASSVTDELICLIEDTDQNNETIYLQRADLKRWVTELSDK